MKCNCNLKEKVLKKLDEIEYKIDLLTDEYDRLNREVYADERLVDYYVDSKLIEYR